MTRRSLLMGVLVVWVAWGNAEMITQWVSVEETDIWPSPEIYQRTIVSNFISVIPAVDLFSLPGIVIVQICAKLSIMLMQRQSNENDLSVLSILSVIDWQISASRHQSSPRPMFNLVLLLFFCASYNKVCPPSWWYWPGVDLLTCVGLLFLCAGPENESRENWWVRTGTLYSQHFAREKKKWLLCVFSVLELSVGTMSENQFENVFKYLLPVSATLTWQTTLITTDDF